MNQPGRLLPIQENENRLPNDYSILDEGDAYSLVNIVPPFLQGLIVNIPSEYISMSEEELRQIVKPDVTLNCLRINFWREYSDSIMSNRAFNFNAVSAGVCTREYMNRVTLDSKFLAWMVLPPRSYMQLQEELLHHGITRLREFLSIDFKDKKTIVREKDTDKGYDRTEVTEEKINTSAVSEARKIVEMLENRLRGSVVQKVAIHQTTTQAAKLEAAIPVVDPMAVIQQALDIIDAGDESAEKPK